MATDDSFIDRCFPEALWCESQDIKAYIKSYKDESWMRRFLKGKPFRASELKGHDNYRLTRCREHFALHAFRKGFDTSPLPIEQTSFQPFIQAGYPIKVWHQSDFRWGQGHLEKLLTQRSLKAIRFQHNRKLEKGTMRKWIERVIQDPRLKSIDLSPTSRYGSCEFAAHRARTLEIDLTGHAVTTDTIRRLSIDKAFDPPTHVLLRKQHWVFEQLKRTRTDSQWRILSNCPFTMRAFLLHGCIPATVKQVHWKSTARLGHHNAAGIIFVHTSYRGRRAPTYDTPWLSRQGNALIDQVFMSPLLRSWEGSKTSPWLERALAHQDDGWSTVVPQLVARRRAGNLPPPLSHLPLHDNRISGMIQAFVGSRPTIIR